METPTNAKKGFVFMLTVILLTLLSYTIYTKFFKQEGFLGKIFGSIGKILKFISMISDFFCWLGNAVRWCVDTVASLFYYIGNIFSGCVLFYFFDMVIGTAWFILFLFAAMFGLGKDYMDASAMANGWRNEIDGYVFEMSGINVFNYSKSTKNKCYKLSFKPFPKWPF
jgi:hypothetical protein